MQKTRFYSYRNGALPEGCRLCVQGKKLVLFVTGLCPRSCYFCPLSEKKFHKDVIFANERPITAIKEIIEEAKVSGAEGCGITGGDPLARFDRTLDVIRMLKKEFSLFHIHLYTPLDLVTEEKIRALEEAGLDEIRFHLDLDDDTLWHKVKIKMKMEKGIEIPCIPGKNIARVLQYVQPFVDFVNLNELEYSDTEQSKLEEHGFVPKNPYSYGIAGSEKLALSMLKKFPDMRIHYCTVKLKDSVQLMNRITLRGTHIKKRYDIQKGPLLIRGAIYGDEPLEQMQKNLSFVATDIDLKKNRLLCSKKEVRTFAKRIKKLGYRPEIVEDLATFDVMEIESTPL